MFIVIIDMLWFDKVEVQTLKVNLSDPVITSKLIVYFKDLYSSKRSRKNYWSISNFWKRREKAAKRRYSDEI